MGDGFRRFVNGKRELQEHRAKLACFAENVEASANVTLVFSGSRGFVGEALPEFGGEEERGICRDTFDPASGVLRVNWLIKRSVDFDGVEKLGEEGGFVKRF